ncbi:MAG: hypothetical protein OEZ06_30515 [Myxococcales bacterium]|nr:hypothetical protein [Myxococcales bacterium]
MGVRLESTEHSDLRRLVPVAVAAAALRADGGKGKAFTRGAKPPGGER